MQDLDAIRAYFSKDRFASEGIGAAIVQAEPGHAVCRMEIQPQHCNALGKPMGGAIFTLADFAFAVAANAGQAPTVSLSSQIAYLSAAKGKSLTAEARAVKRGRSTCYYQIDISDELGTAVACVTTTGFVMSGTKPSSPGIEK